MSSPSSCFELAARFLSEVREEDPATLASWLAALVERGLLPPTEHVVIRQHGGERVVVPLETSTPAALTAAIAAARRQVQLELADADLGMGRYIEDALFARRVAREPRGGELEWVVHLGVDDALSDWVLALAAVARLESATRG